MCSSFAEESSLKPETEIILYGIKSILNICYKKIICKFTIITVNTTSIFSAHKASTVGATKISTEQTEFTADF